MSQEEVSAHHGPLRGAVTVTDLREAFDLKRSGEAHIIESPYAEAIALALHHHFPTVPTRADCGHVYAETQDQRNQDVFRAFAAGWAAGRARR